MKIKKFKASVKVMISYDFSHFEVSLASDKVMTIEEINGMRKVSQRLVDEAIRQYKVAKVKASERANILCERKRLENEVAKIKDKPKSEMTAEDKAKIKALGDHAYWTKHDYDYEDDWED